MTADEWMQHWEDAVKRAEKNLEDVPQTYRELEYWRGVVPYKHILRNVRMKAGLAICWGAVDCLDYPVAQCLNGHETCAKHKDLCFLCKEVGRD